MDSQLNGHYPGHIFYIMAIHFLQQINPPVIPVLHEVEFSLNCRKQLIVPVAMIKLPLENWYLCVMFANNIWFKIEANNITYSKQSCMLS